MHQCTMDVRHVLTGEAKVPVYAHMGRITLRCMRQCTMDVGHVLTG
jgi:hypothetical protein